MPPLSSRHNRGHTDGSTRLLDADTQSRREFLALMGASLALAGTSGCSVKPSPPSEIVPYVHPPQEIVPGRPLFFATTMAMAGEAVGLLAESHLGRPTKIEGNPLHPGSLGATGIFQQASILTLYDPDRSATVLHLDETRTWADAGEALREALGKQRLRHGAGLRVLTESIVSPTLAQQLEDLFKAYPEAKWHLYEPVNRDAAYEGAKWAFGDLVSTVYDFTKVDVVLSLDEDFLAAGPGSLRYTADFMTRRRVRTSPADASQAAMNRLYVVETALSCTGAKADHRLAAPPSAVENIARAIAARLGIETKGLPVGAAEKWVDVVARDLRAHRGRSLVLAGYRQPPIVHLLAHALNDHLGNVGQTVIYIDPVEARPTSQTQSLRELADDMLAGQVEFLVILGGNPVYSSPADIPFAQALQQVPLRMHLAQYRDETSLLCHWHLPEAHYLEAWGDGRAYDGTASLAQPLIEPLHAGRSALEVVAMLARQEEQPGREIVRAYWRRQWEESHLSGDFDVLWQTALHDGVIAGTAREPKPVKLKTGWEKHLQRSASPSTAPSAETEKLEIVFQPDSTIYDGRFANNAWLQELPKPITETTWGNTAILGPATASQLGLQRGEYAHGGEHGGYWMPVVWLNLGEREVQAPVWIMPGHAEGAVTVYLGHGRQHAGKVGGSGKRVVGFNACRLRTSTHPWFASGLGLFPTGRRELVACTQAHYDMAGREPVRAATLAKYQRQPDFATNEREKEQAEAPESAEDRPSLYDPISYEPPVHRWGMVIDLTTCIGCQACVVACQAENNIPVVGKDQVAFGRIMHWLRVDRYLCDSPNGSPEIYFQPVPCMHCEKAPCEYVCPTEATVHSAEGLNDMIYNRCVGTRFCSNNCPYKVRRFNFFHYADYDSRLRGLQYNPDVTVRSRGVMEKCTYCVQRIRQAEIDAEAAGRPIYDGEVLTACQAVCPARAIVFGDLNDSNSEVCRWRDSPLNYGLLADLNTQPRTNYLAALRNPNPELEA